MAGSLHKDLQDLGAMMGFTRVVDISEGMVTWSRQRASQYRHLDLMTFNNEILGLAATNNVELHANFFIFFTYKDCCHNMPTSINICGRTHASKKID